MPCNISYACLDCRKAFKRPVHLQNMPEHAPCPECGGPMHDFGRHFKAPRQDDIKQWKKVRFLIEHGFRFQKIRTGPGHHDTVPYPDTLEEARTFVVTYRRFASPASVADDAD
ncbi:hypothetical protein GCM10027285_11360 [Oleiagrimonas citrea]|uniref:Uncharacterized protein n=1 Tax=Oleiagrimonas citrea TaxID=1665687 RepID=A0A846ZLH0_9GAMM|nr:hypothetical protein [Oleiagrimonas citrea]NKZ38301.1 hypothetical protein [Oleiagrimonas citrea]